MLDFTEAQEWLRTKTGDKTLAIRSAMAANDIDGAFNCVCYDVLSKIHSHYHFLKCLLKGIQSYNMERQIKISFDGVVENPASYPSSLPEDSPPRTNVVCHLRRST